MSLYVMIAILCAASFKDTVAANRIPMDGFAAVVNDKVITVSEVTSAMQPLERQLQQSFVGEELRAKLDEAYSSTLESLIERELILISFRHQQGAIPDTVVESRMDEIERTRFADNRAELIKALAAEGLTMDEWRESLRNTMIVSFMREREVDNRIVISPREVREAYEEEDNKYSMPPQVELRMIAVSHGITDEEFAIKRKQAEDIRQRVVEGQDFAETARQVSEGIKADEGGYWGWIDPSSRRKELAEIIRDMEVGAVSEVIETDDMFYLVKLEGRRKAAQIPFDEAQDKIRDELHRARARALYDEWIKRLKRNAFIRRF